MTPALPLPGPSVPVPADRVRLIRRSTRCFVFGILGAVPLLGIGPACLALLLHRQVGEETGEPKGPGGIYSSAAVFYILAVMLLYLGQAGFVLALGFLLSAVQAYLLRRQYLRTEPLDWNPARHLTWWGAWLALAGLNLSGTLILLAIWAVVRNLSG
jgi:hypothetical protein